MGDATPDQLIEGLARVCERVGLSPPVGLERLTGGATMESWRFACDDEAFVLRRAPSLEFMKDRPFGHDVEAAVIEAACARGVTAPEVVAVLEQDDGIGSGFVMRALPGTPNPKEILEFDDPEALLKQAARDLARIHSIRRGDVPDAVPVMDYRQAIADLKQQFLDAGGDRPIIALGLKWMEDHCPDPVEPVLIHGDYRMGNLLAERGKLTGVLDWELAHFGDRHEDLAFGCMAVWRFARYDRPALGLGSLEDYLAAYEAEARVKVDRERFRYWLIHRTVWWALGCLRMAKIWRSGEDRMLERVVISRRTSENELDLVMLLDDSFPSGLTVPDLFRTYPNQRREGEATLGEMARAVSEWLATVKDHMEGHDRFQLAVARNALGIIERGGMAEWDATNDDLASFILQRPAAASLADPRMRDEMRHLAMHKVAQDSPKYPALAAARKKWTGET